MNIDTNFMPEGEKQEGQKTVVAFITGLLIGGLLVWVFSSTPEEVPQIIEESVNTEEVMNEEVASETETQIVRDGSIVVPDQVAGSSVELGVIQLPVVSGWIVVRDYMDGVPGNILGAARFNADESLMPASVELMRSTVAESSYQVVFYTNDGDLSFNIGEDVAIEGVSTTFTAL